MAAAFLAFLAAALAVGIWIGKRGAQAAMRGLPRLWHSTAWLREPVGSDDEAAWW